MFSGISFDVVAFIFSSYTVLPLITFIVCIGNCISGIMVSVLALSAVDLGFESQSGQTKDYEIGICCFTPKHSTLRRKSKDGLAQNQNNVSEESDMSTHRLLFQ